MTKDKLETIVESRAIELKRYFEQVQDDLLLQSESPVVIDAAKDFAGAWQQIEGDAETILQQGYMVQNPFPAGEKDKLQQANLGLWYDSVHGRYHRYFSRLLTRNGYYDVFLFDLEGNLTYTVAKEADFATNFKSGGGTWSASDLGKAFRAGEVLAPGQIAFFLILRLMRQAKICQRPSCRHH